MGFISGLLGGSSGADFKAGAANVVNPATVQQADQAYGQTQQGLAQQLAFIQALQGANGIQNQSNVFNQLQGVANGTGPNPAQAMLNNSTGQNVANQAALMAGQRGASANAGLIARQAGMQGANLQQQAVGQGAAMQANQALNAMGQMGNIAGQQVQNQAQATMGYNQAAQGQQQNVLNAVAQQNSANVQNSAQQNSANAGVAQQNAKSQAGGLGGLLGGIGTAVTGIKFAEGGKIPGGPRSAYALHMASGGVVPQPTMNAGGNVPAMVSPGEKVLSPQEAQKVAQGAPITQVGKAVPGKPAVKGDSLKNDTVPAKLPEGGMVIPKSVMESDDPVKHAIAFVRAHMNKQSAMTKKKA